MKRNSIFAMILILVLTLSSAAFAADEYKIDPVHSSANFAVRHMLVSTVKGRFTEVNGTILYDQKDPTKSSVKAVIKVASITTDNGQRDGHLKSPDFFDAAKYPEIQFVSTRVEKRGDQLVAIGNLTIKDVTKEVELPFTIVSAEMMGKKRIGVDSSIKLIRYDYHVSYDPTGAAVSKEVTIDLNLEAGSTAPAPAAK
jgi:polyisoprenoid-binding protein YceI